MTAPVTTGKIRQTPRTTCLGITGMAALLGLYMLTSLYEDLRLPCQWATQQDPLHFTGALQIPPPVWKAIALDPPGNMITVMDHSRWSLSVKAATAELPGLRARFFRMAVLSEWNAQAAAPPTTTPQTTLPTKTLPIPTLGARMTGWLMMPVRRGPRPRSFWKDPFLHRPRNTCILNIALKSKLAPQHTGMLSLPALWRLKWAPSGAVWHQQRGRQYKTGLGTGLPAVVPHLGKPMNTGRLMSVGPGAAAAAVIMTDLRLPTATPHRRAAAATPAADTLEQTDAGEGPIVTTMGKHRGPALPAARQGPALQLAQASQALVLDDMEC
ncbi:unnamed protein product [Symbiodinium sp. CCMP2592]|nr:unnamed protein product [Symbiodinium sp. CCMP2592]